MAAEGEYREIAGVPDCRAMIRGVTLSVPGSLASLLAVSGPLFTAPSFRTFRSLACGFLAQTGRRTVCGMLAGAGLSRAWPHDRAHWFFSRAQWSVGELGLAAARLVAGLLVPAGEPVAVAIDDTLFKRRGKKVLILSFRVSRCCDLRRPVVDSVADGTLAA